MNKTITLSDYNAEPDIDYDEDAACQCKPACVACIFGSLTVVSSTVASVYLFCPCCDCCVKEERRYSYFFFFWMVRVCVGGE